eukprot:scaffold134664_cov26-Prasinocladus_malaysianus.AAC.1
MSTVRVLMRSLHCRILMGSPVRRATIRANDLTPSTQSCHHNTIQPALNFSLIGLKWFNYPCKRCVHARCWLCSSGRTVSYWDANRTTRKLNYWAHLR